MSKRLDLKNKRFGRLRVLEFSHIKNEKAYWLCKCEEGNEIVIQGSYLISGRTKSCGCYQKEQVSKAKFKHGHSPGNSKPSSTYISWANMIQRVTNPNNSGWDDYGGAGITICPRWFNSFNNFLKDMSERPLGKSLDRYPDPYGNYEPDNCRWATPTEQRINQRSGRKKRRKVLNS